jgi:dihydrolipoamide dehydrogenase
MPVSGVARLWIVQEKNRDNMATAKEFDLVIIGSGPGGYVSAIRAAQLGMKAALVEKSELGGICLNWGCIPTKALLKSAEVVETFHHAGDYGVSVDKVEPDFGKIIARSRGIADRVSKGVSFLMKKNKIPVIRGRARLTGPGEALVLDPDGNETDRIKAPNILLCTGSRPRAIPGVPFDGARVISSREAMSLKHRPDSLVIIGGGAIGVEFAYFYQALGTKVTVVEMLPSLLPIEDVEISAVVERAFKKMKMGVLTGARVTSVKPGGDGVEVALTDKKGREKILTADKVLVAIGVQGNVEDLGLEEAGVEHEHSFIRVDASYKTSAPGIFAIGDVIGPPLLAHVASHEGILSVERMAGKKVHDVDYDAIPGCTYCQPQVASIGFTEARAIVKYGKVRVGRFNFRGLGRAVASGHLDGMAKLIFDPKEGKLVGGHLVGHDATELLGELILARFAGYTYKAMGETMHAHPSLTEAIMEAALDAGGRAIQG